MISLRTQVFFAVLLFLTCSGCDRTHQDRNEAGHPDNFCTTKNTQEAEKGCQHKVGRPCTWSKFREGDRVKTVIGGEEGFVTCVYYKLGRKPAAWFIEVHIYSSVDLTIRKYETFFGFELELVDKECLKEDD